MISLHRVLDLLWFLLVTHRALRFHSDSTTTATGWWFIEELIPGQDRVRLDTVPETGGWEAAGTRRQGWLRYVAHAASVRDRASSR